MIPISNTFFVQKKRLLRRAELEREAEELRIKRKEEERKKWWAGVDLFISRDEESPTASVDEVDKEQVERSILKERYSMNYSRWNQWTPTDPVSLKEVCSFSIVFVHRFTNDTFSDARTGGGGGSKKKRRIRKE